MFIVCALNKDLSLVALRRGKVGWWLVGMGRASWQCIGAVEVTNFFVFGFRWRAGERYNVMGPVAEGRGGAKCREASEERLLLLK